MVYIYILGYIDSYGDSQIYEDHRFMEIFKDFYRFLKIYGRFSEILLYFCNIRLAS